MRVPAALAALVAFSFAACGDGSDRSAEPDKRVRPIETPCRDLQTRAAAQRVAERLDHLLIAPEDQPRRVTVRSLADSLRATCRQPTLPGVQEPLDYRPARPVIRQLQREFDEHELEGH